MTSPSQTPAARRVYRGGWSSSICDLFRDSSQRSSFCALACCGLLLSDRNRYLATHEMPSPWFKRLLWCIGLPLGLFVILSSLARVYATQDTVQYWLFGTIMLFCSLLAVLGYRAQTKRVQVRQLILTRLYEEAGSRSIPLEQWLRGQSHDTNAAHASLCGCIHNDVLYHTDESTTDRRAQSSRPDDLCGWLWQLLTSLCCGAFFNCWIQSCGMCATGQEDRELQRLLPKDKFQVDYITFQPYRDYVSKLDYLRQHQVCRFWRHVKSMSQLAYKLVNVLGLFVLVLALIALSNIDQHFHSGNLLVVLATFFQAFFILYFVHWQWNRFDLSLDAVVKYFSSGFLLCTVMALVYELCLSAALSLGLLLLEVTAIAAESDPDQVPQDEQAKKEFMKTFLQQNVWIVVLSVFLNAFVVAALVEELIKYFGYWMVEHPDMMDPDLLVLTVGEDDDEVISRPSKRSVSSVGAGITVAMVATALGFACCENLVYVFVYTPPTVTNEIATLVARSIFPVHPLCAAIQSIGVCQRDLEGNQSQRLGRILFPALLLHGSFDFVLMLLATLSQVYGDNPEDETSGNTSKVTLRDIVEQWPSLTSSVVIVTVGIVYYTHLARSQRSRLAELDRGHMDGATSHLVV